MIMMMEMSRNGDDDGNGDNIIVMMMELFHNISHDDDHKLKEFKIQMMARQLSLFVKN